MKTCTPTPPNTNLISLQIYTGLKNDIMGSEMAEFSQLAEELPPCNVKSNDLFVAFDRLNRTVADSNWLWQPKIVWKTRISLRRALIKRNAWNSALPYSAPWSCTRTSSCCQLYPEYNDNTTCKNHNTLDHALPSLHDIHIKFQPISNV